ncbi:hypothetical protein [Cupriavidus sp. WS]|uniref:hypothetical protein n=1 Tax=Cupriavidus sp. WS TaxID=1312922 RepID=UPI00035FF70B|nr:hypothetical protein [Cupriavidus sp. WS]
MLPLLALHALVAHRGDGLRPELLAALERRAGWEAGLGAGIESDDGQPGRGTEVAAAEKNHRDEA